MASRGTQSRRNLFEQWAHASKQACPFKKPDDDKTTASRPPSQEDNEEEPVAGEDLGPSSDEEIYPPRSKPKFERKPRGSKAEWALRQIAEKLETIAEITDELSDMIERTL